MATTPNVPGQFLSGPISIIRAFIRLREVRGGVACLNLGKKGLDHRAILRINTVNFSLMSEEDQDVLIEGFRGFLNGLAFPIQILVRNLPHNLERYLQSVEAIQGELAEMAQDHADFVRQLSSKRALVKRAFYVIVPADYDATAKKDEAWLNAQTQLKMRVDELMRHLERLGLTGQRLQDEEIIALYHSCLSPDDARNAPLPASLIEGVDKVMVSARTASHQTALVPITNTALTPAPPPVEMNIQQGKQHKSHNKKVPLFMRLPELLSPSSIQISPWHLRIDGETGHEYARTLALVNYPRSAYPGWLDSIIQIDEPHIDFSIHILPLESSKVNQRLSRKATEFRGSVLIAQRQGRTPDPGTAIALQDIEHLRENLARGDERVFSIAVFVQVRGNTRPELAERSARVMSAIRSMDFRALPAHWEHHAGLLSCLPDAHNDLGRARLFGTGAASTFYPFTGGDISMESGVMFGVLPTGSLVIINPFKSDELENANMVVFAKSGAGKSFFLKTTAGRLLSTCNVYVIDPEAEYSAMCERVYGQYVRLSPDSLQFNPLELYGQRVQRNDVAAQEDLREEGNFFREKLLNMITLLELLLSDDGSLSQKEKSFLYKCLIKTYENRGITLNPLTHSRPAPNMHELYLIMTSVARGDLRFGVGTDVYGLSERLERYLHLFPRNTAITLDKRFVDFNIRELTDSLKPIGLFLITEFLWTKMRQTRQALAPQPNAIILIDEAWLLMQFPQGAKFLAEFARRIRKYGGGLWCTTQNSDDFLNTEEGRTILAMSTMKFLMKQDASTIDSVVRTFRLSPGQRNYLLGARRGEGLFSTKNWTAMEVVASPKEAEMANTTVGSLASSRAAYVDHTFQQLEAPPDLTTGAFGNLSDPFALEGSPQGTQKLLDNGRTAKGLQEK